MIRAFVAIKIDSNTIDNIAAASARLEHHLKGVRWITQDNIHLTIKFLGDIDELMIPPISQALEGALCPFPRFTINAKGLGVFPGLKRPRILWVGLEAANLAQLAAAVESALEPLGFVPEQREFKPHLTIGRWRGFHGSSVQLAEEIARWHDYHFGQSAVTEAILFRSVLKAHGAEYHPLKVVTLAPIPLV